MVGCKPNFKQHILSLRRKGLIGHDDYSFATYCDDDKLPAMEQRQGNDSFVPSNDPKDETKQLSERQKLIVLLIQENDTITINEMALKANVAEITIKRELATLQELSILTREGGRKDGRWVIIKPHE